MKSCLTITDHLHPNDYFPPFLLSTHSYYYFIYTYIYIGNASAYSLRLQWISLMMQEVT